MAGASRLLVASARALQSDHLSLSSILKSSWMRSFHLPMGEFGWNGRKRVAVSSEISIVSPEQKQNTLLKEGMECVELISSIVAKLTKLILELVNQWRRVNASTYWRMYSEILIENGIIGCQSFTLIAIAGILIGSVLCFVEGCFFVLESFLQYFRVISLRLDQGGIIKPAIEAIDMFLVGTAMLTFGMGLYVMFIDSDNITQKRSKIADSNFGTFSLKKLAESMEMQSITQAKSKLGHAILLILQAGVLDKCKTVPLIGGFDLACFGGAVFFSSVCVYLLSKLTLQKQMQH